MAKLQRDPIRLERIHNEVVVDAYGPEEQSMGWYYLSGEKNPIPIPVKVYRCQVGFAQAVSEH